ncbi:MAG TPA: hypothetical protein VMD53_17245 [Rhizomicrobium sp.]|nr:hypothetical protein [Rhizomicrobium sp.]
MSSHGGGDRLTLTPYARVRAIFTPARRDDLKAGAERHIGEIAVFEALWTIDDGPYTGDMAFRLPEAWGEIDAGWIPERDLQILEIVRAGLPSDL